MILSQLREVGLKNLCPEMGLSHRRKTTVGQYDPAQLIDRLISYVLYVRRLLKTFHYTPSHIICMDETRVWNDMIAVTTVARRGEKTISLKSTDHEKVLVSVCLNTAVHSCFRRKSLIEI